MVAALTPAEFAATLAAIGGFEARPRLAVAVSGGPDSLALVLLAEGWARQRGGAVHAVTVDHGLRPQSAAEARSVAGWLAARGIAHDTVRWLGDKPTSGIQAAARAARYDLLAAWCRAHGILHLLTAHHRDDQVETHLIRRRAGSGIDGLAGMSAVRELAGCRLVRPLLSVPRTRLLALLEAERQPFLRDPSNFDPAFERARLRAEAAAGDGSEWETALAALRDCGHRRIAREHALAALLARAVALHPAGFAVIDRAALAAADDESVERLLGRVALCFGAPRYPPRRARLARLRSFLAAAPERARTLGGCRFVPWRGRLLVMRELAAAAPPLRLEPGARLVWDRRFAVTLAPDAATGFTLDYLGRHGAAPIERRGGGLPRLVYPVLPALWDEQGLAAVPHLGYRRAGVGALPLLAFCPDSALTTAGFTVV